MPESHLAQVLPRFGPERIEVPARTDNLVAEGIISGIEPIQPRREPSLNIGIDLLPFTNLYALPGISMERIQVFKPFLGGPVSPYPRSMERLNLALEVTPSLQEYIQVVTTEQHLGGKLFKGIEQGPNLCGQRRPGIAIRLLPLRYL